MTLFFAFLLLYTIYGRLELSTAGERSLYNIIEAERNRQCSLVIYSPISNELWLGDLQRLMQDTYISGVVGLSTLNDTKRDAYKKMVPISCNVLVDFVSSEQDLNAINTFESYMPYGYRRVIVILSANDSISAISPWMKSLCSEDHGFNIEFYDSKLSKIGDSRVLCRTSLFRVGYLFKTPFLRPLPTSECCKGADYNVLMELNSILEHSFFMDNVEFQMIHVPTYSELSLMAGNGSLDIALCQLVMLSTRFHVLDFTRRVGLVELIWKSPKLREIVSYTTLFIPFDILTWILVFCSFAVIVGLQLALEQGQNLKEEQARFQAFRAVMLGSFIFTQESLPHRWFKGQIMGRYVVGFTWILTSCLLGMAYQSNLFSILATKRYEKPIEGPRDVLDLDYTLYLPDIDNATNNFFFLSSPNPYMKRVFLEASVAKGGLYDYRDSVEIINDRIASGKSVAMWEKRGRLVDGNAFYYSKNYLHFQLTGYALPKHHWLTPILDRLIEQLHAGGIYYHWMDQFTERKSIVFTLPTKTAEGDGLSLTQLAVTMVIIGLGLGLSVVAFVGEISSSVTYMRAMNRIRIKYWT